MRRAAIGRGRAGISGLKPFTLARFFRLQIRERPIPLQRLSPITLTGTKSGVYQVIFWAMDYNPNQSAASRPAVSGTFAVSLDGKTDDVTINGSYNHLLTGTGLVVPVPGPPVSTEDNASERGGTTSSMLRTSIWVICRLARTLVLPGKETAMGPRRRGAA